MTSAHKLYGICLLVHCLFIAVKLYAPDSEVREFPLKIEMETATIA